jgi:hypothetical protein
MMNPFFVPQTMRHEGVSSGCPRRHRAPGRNVPDCFPPVERFSLNDHSPFALSCPAADSMENAAYSEIITYFAAPNRTDEQSESGKRY